MADRLRLVLKNWRLLNFYAFLNCKFPIIWRPFNGYTHVFARHHRPIVSKTAHIGFRNVGILVNQKILRRETMAKILI